MGPYDLAEKISVSNAEGRAENLILSTASFQTASIQTSSGNSDSLQQKIELCVAKVNNLYSRLVGSLGLKVDPLCEVGKGAAVKNSSQRGEPVKLQQATREATRAVEEEDFAFDPFDLPLGCVPPSFEHCSCLFPLFLSSLPGHVGARALIA